LFGSATRRKPELTETIRSLPFEFLTPLNCQCIIIHFIDEWSLEEYSPAQLTESRILMNPVELPEARVAEITSGVAAYLRRERELYFRANEPLCRRRRTSLWKMK